MEILSEEEIIRKINKLIIKFEGTREQNDTYYVFSDDIDALQDLLSLYNKQNELLQKYYVSKKQYEQTKKALKGQISEKDKRIKELEEDNKHQWEERCKMAIELDNDVIPKSKIKAKIEEIDNYGDTKSFSPALYKTKKGVEILKADAELILEELLEE